MYSAYKFNKQGDNIQLWRTPCLIWNQSVVPCPVLTVASWPAYRFLKRQGRWSAIPISFRIFQFIVIHTVKGFGIVIKFSSVQSLSCVRLFATPRIAAHQASLSITNSWSLLKVMSIESVMPSSHLILCRPLLLLPPIPPSIRVFSNESTLHTRWPKYWSFSFSIRPSNRLVLFHSVQLLSRVRLFATLWTTAHHASLSITISWSLLKLMSIELVMPSNHLILWLPLLLLPSILPSIRVFSSEFALHIRWPKYWSFSISPSNEHLRLISFRIDWFYLFAVQGTLESV